MKRLVEIGPRGFAAQSL